MTMKPFIYTTYIITSPEKLWTALTNGEFTNQYFFGRVVQSDWQEGSKVEYVTSEGDLDVSGEVLIAEPFKKLSVSWIHVNDHRKVPAIVTFRLKKMNEAVKLTLVHENLQENDLVEEENSFAGLNNGWPAILSNLKSLLETGKVMSVMNM